MKENKTLFRLEDGIAVITLNAPHNLNAIDVEMADELLALLRRCNDDSQIKVVVLNSSGKAFSAGGDIGYLYQRIQSGDDLSKDTRLVKRVGQLALDIKRMDKLVITSVNGAAAGAGANLALSGDFVVASESSKFIQAFAGVGLVPDTGGVYLLSRMIGSQRALELCVTCRPLPAEEARELGLVYQVCAPEELEEATMKLARKLAAGPLISYRGTKRQIYAASYADLEGFLRDAEEPTMMDCVATEDYREAVTAFVEKRPPRFQGR